jgi:hypothetical protein
MKYIDNYAYYNKVLLKQPSVGKEQSLLFTTIVEQRNELGRLVPDVYKRFVDITCLDRLYDHYIFKIEYLDADFDIKGDARRDTDFVKEISFVFDELWVKVGFNGYITEVLNTDLIIQRWNHVKTTLSEDNEGEEIEAYVALMDTFVNNPEALAAYVNLPSMYGSYFNGYWRQYFYEKQYEGQIQFGIELDNVIVHEQLQLKKVEREDDAQLVEIFGSLHKEKHTQSNIQFAVSYAKYFNGFLDSFERIITFPDVKVTYTTSWLGLKPLTKI